MKNLCVILARGGSKGIPKKNIVDVCGKPLIHYTIKAALKSNIFSEIVVSTDCKKIANIAIKEGAKVPFTRPDNLSGDQIWSRDALKHAVLESEKVYNKMYDYVMELPCVAPLRTEKHIVDVYNKILKTKADSVVSVVDISKNHMHPIRMKRITNDILYSFCQEYPENECSRRQDLESCYVRNGAIFAMTRKCIVEDFSRVGKVCRPYVMQDYESINIDTELDLKIARILIEEKLKKVDYNV